MSGFKKGFAKADTDKEQTQQTTPQIETEPININTINNSLNFKMANDEDSFVENVESVLMEHDTSILAQLIAQQKEYEALLVNAVNENEINQIQRLINETKRLITVIINNGTNVLSEDEEESNKYSLAIAAAIGYFNLCNYRLSSELLTHMSENTVYESYYYPLYRYRIMSSDITYSLALGTEINGASSYEADGTINGNDLRNAIHKFDFNKPSPESRVISISDKYDFKADDYTGVEQLIINELARAQESGELIPFYTKIYILVKRF